MSPQLKEKSKFKEGETVEHEPVSKDGKKGDAAGTIESIVVG